MARIKTSKFFQLFIFFYIFLDVSAEDPTLSATVLGGDLEPFDIPLEELEKDTKQVTTLSEQCKRFVNHYRYYCRSSNIATYNEEVRIICERYRNYCSDRVYPAINHIRRQTKFWEGAGVPKATIKAMSTCYSHCKETDPVCVNACECLHLQWMMNYECYPGTRAPAYNNCQRWAAKCRTVWKPRQDYTPADYRDMAPPPIVRGVFYGYDGLATHRTFDRPRDHGVSFFRGTNTVLVDWPEGKVAGGTTIEVPFAGVNVIPNQYNIGFPNMQRAMREFTKQNPDQLNPGTGRMSALAMMQRT
ncbi:Protein CBR-DOS-2 [Caenorhabditis briggsae]|uniref:Protein CBR-DOS-2 n=2 Tax=Caenorhabditis briggsae TaxID=6238 RepID=A8XTB5_CAEBR|nr:Protein CBR-DOS-2 [Caenorhabditis briggsae]ULU03945.1 hypothetical protein L3Y34_017026 [Caenorhabditis briggsae]CAP35892.1 Protein CBR-DOS-2 [Caenorhabditis briggsae]